MKVQNIIPDAKIAGFVDRILVLEDEVFQDPFILPLYANGVPTLMFKTVKGKLGKYSGNYLTLFGQTIFPEQLTLDEGFTLIAYFFKPYTLIPLFGVAGYELTDKPVDLNAVSPKKTHALQEELLNSDSIGRMIQVLDNYIFDRIRTSVDIAPGIVYASEKIAFHYSKEALSGIQKELNVTERTFQRMFDKYIGTSPNAYRRICQFNSAFVDLNLGHYSNLSDIAFHHGYADQSHYIRAFREFTNITPREYLNFGAP